MDHVRGRESAARASPRLTVVTVHLTGVEAPYAYGLAAAVLVIIGLLLVAIRSRRGLRRRLSAVTLRLGPEVEDVGRHRLEAVMSRLERAAEQSRLEAVDSKELAGRLASALDAVDWPVLVADETGALVFQNATAWALEAAPDQVVVSRALHGLARQARSLDSGTEARVEVFGPPRRAYRVRAAPVVAGTGPLCVVATAEDTTAQEQAERTRRDLVADAGRHLREPLTSMAALADLLVTETSGPVTRRLAGRLAEQARSAAGTAADLLELARLDDGAGPRRRPVELGGLIREAACARADRAAGLRIPVEVEIPADRAAVEGDPDQLRAALVHLLDNAMEASEPGRPVEVRMEIDPGRAVRVEVTDHGRGIAPADRDRLFDRFHRVGRREAEDRRTGGLGLALVRQVIESHGGTVGLRSIEGCGSTLELTLPLGRGASPAGGEGPPPAAGGAEVSAGGSPRPR